MPKYEALGEVILQCRILVDASSISDGLANASDDIARLSTMIHKYLKGTAANLAHPISSEPGFSVIEIRFLSKS